MSTDKQPIILHLPKWYPTEYDDMNGIFVKRHIATVSNVTKSVVVFAQAIDNPTSKFDRQLENNIITYRFFYAKKITGILPIDKLLKFILYFNCLSKGYRLCEKEVGVPNLVHVHVLLRTSLFALYIHLFRNIPFVITEHWSIYKPEKKLFTNPIRRFLSRVVIRKAKAVTTVSKDLQIGMQFQKLRNSRYLIIPNVVDIDAFKVKKQHPETIQALHISEFNEHDKNVSGILRVFSRLAENNVPIKLNIIGYGDYEKRLHVLAKELGLWNKNVYFLGKRYQHEVVSAFKESAFFILFSHYESQSCVTIEALATGTPVIATNVGGIPEIVSSKEGILVSPDNEDELYEGIMNMINDYKKYDPAKLREKVAEKFSTTTIQNQFNQLYQSIIS